MNIPHDLEVSIIYADETLSLDGNNQISNTITLDWIGSSPYVWFSPEYLIKYGGMGHLVPGILVTIEDYTFQIIGCDTLRDLWLLERISPPMS